MTTILLSIFLGVSLVFNIILIVLLIIKKRNKPTQEHKEQQISTIEDYKKWIDDFLMGELAKFEELEKVLSTAEGDEQLINHLKDLDTQNTNASFETDKFKDWNRNITVDDNNSNANNLNISGYIKGEKRLLYAIGCDFSNMINHINDYYSKTKETIEQLSDERKK